MSSAKNGFSFAMIVLLIQFLSTDDRSLGVVESFQGIAVLVVESTELTALGFGDCVCGGRGHAAGSGLFSSASSVRDIVPPEDMDQRSSVHTRRGEVRGLGGGRG